MVINLPLYLLKEVNMMSKVNNNDKRIQQLAQDCLLRGNIDKELYSKYNVNIGLRDLNGKGVLTGLTDIREIRQTVSSFTAAST